METKRQADDLPNYTASYSAVDFGTERTLIVKDAVGNVLGVCDPFYPQGIPLDAHRRAKIALKAAQRIIEKTGIRYCRLKFEGGV